MKTLTGGCHCKAVRFEVDVAADPIPLLDCNCSMSSAAGFLHLIAAKDAFRLLSGGYNLGEYRFGEGVARHLFCKTCGIKSFYVPRSHPDGYSVNARCLDDYVSLAFAVEAFDGRDWEAARERLG
ncbi:GFA family protein [Sphingosinicella soli]|uniref:CENP-V/GFA domain-containing protein n=1 Tax=Sphingosinicella soli TaxID=333708 RepID=A0A7W7F737_9SPHN|nr:GFA family protein [Sphingosinicella soli]MBB4633006.1 hypothetical protein [Sphingosinicella soli]